jgi:hypothetical protein
VDGGGQIGAAVVNPGRIKVVQCPVHAGWMNLTAFSEKRDFEPRGQGDIHTLKYRTICDQRKRVFA